MFVKKLASAVSKEIKLVEDKRLHISFVIHHLAHTTLNPHTSHTLTHTHTHTHIQRKKAVSVEKENSGQLSNKDDDVDNEISMYLVF